jgi:pimeloyl-ACP methyl ester carboxylesterase
MQLCVNGIDTFVATGGRKFDSSQPTIVLLHGAGFDHTTWALHSRWFAHHGHSVLAPDLPGHGRCSGAPLTTIADMADWTAARRRWRRKGLACRSLHGVADCA